MRAFLVKFFSIHESFFPSRAPHLSHIHYIFIRKIVNFSFIIVNSVWCFSKKKKKIILCVTECGDAFKN